MTETVSICKQFFFFSDNEANFVGNVLSFPFVPRHKMWQILFSEITLNQKAPEA